MFTRICPTCSLAYNSKSPVAECPDCKPSLVGVPLERVLSPPLAPRVVFICNPSPQPPRD